MGFREIGIKVEFRCVGPDRGRTQLTPPWPERVKSGWLGWIANLQNDHDFSSFFSVFLRNLAQINLNIHKSTISNENGSANRKRTESHKISCLTYPTKQLQKC